MNVIVVGGGRMGLPLACVLADRGAAVTVCDINRDIVNAVNKGQTPYDEPLLEEYLARNHAAGRLKASLDTAEAASAADAAVIIVPAHLTPDRDIDYHILQAASKEVGKGLRKGALVSYETTVAVGGTRRALVPVLEQHSGMRAGLDFRVCFSPERVKAKHVFAKLQETPKVVGGFDEASARAGEAFYGTYLGARVINVGSLEAAELVKLAGMLYRDVNIALANELAAYCEATGEDFFTVVAAANNDGESGLLLPGIGVGGHCTPVYPYFVIRDGERRDAPQRLATAARQINDEQPRRNVDRLIRQWGPVSGKRVHIMGLAFRPDVKVDIFSTAYPLREVLQERGAHVTLEDPLYTEEELQAAGFKTAVAGRDPMDVVMGNTAHQLFMQPDFSQWRAAGVTAIVDGRNMWQRNAVEAAGILYLGVGKG